MKRVVIIAVLVLTMAIPAVGEVSPALREISFNNFGSGARAFAMGNAFVGVSNDISGGTWNPAGLLDLEGPSIALSFMRFAPNGKFTDLNTTGDTDMDLGLSGIGHFSFVSPIRIKGHPWAFTFNYNRGNDYSDIAEYQSEYINLVNPDTRSTEERYLVTYNFGFSTRIYKKLSLGFTANIRESHRTRESLFKSLLPVTIDEVYGITVDYASDVQRIDSTISNGFNFNLGAMYKMDKLSFGLVAALPYTMRHNTDRSYFITTTINDLGFIDASDTIFVTDSVAEQDQPLAITFGLAYTPNADLTITSDLLFQKYGSTNWYLLESYLIDAGGQRIETFEEIPIAWNNTIGIGLGVEYVKSTGFGQLPLRAGFRYDQLPQSEDFVYASTTVLDSLNEPTGEFILDNVASGQQSSIGLSLGSGIHWSQIHLDFAWRYSSGAKQTISNVWDGFVATKRTLEYKVQEFRFTFTGIF